MPAPYSAAAQAFGHSLMTQFAIKMPKATTGPEEIKKFEALIDSFSALGIAWCRVESYHGARSQVEFAPVMPWTRSTPRCELSDVLFVVYGSKGIRLSFLQAKAVCGSKPPFPLRVANTEQYVVLAHRPKIKTWKNGQLWPDDILENAILPSVGSFGVFFDVPISGGHEVEFAYVVADQLQAVGGPCSGTYVSGLFGISPSITVTRTVGGFDETLFCSGLGEFGAALYSMEVGTPIHPAVDAAYGPVTGPPYSLSARLSLATWIDTQDNSNLLGPLRAMLEIRNDGQNSSAPKSVGARHVVVIQSQD